MCRVNTPRKQGGLGPMNIPLLADKKYDISKAYGVYKEDEGVTFRYAVVHCDTWAGMGNCVTSIFPLFELL